MCNFGIAVNRTWKDNQGQQQNEATFVDCEAWGRTADVICQYLIKGKPIFVEGRLKLDTWEDKTTNAQRSKLKVVVERFQFVGGKADTGTTSMTGPVTAVTPIDDQDDIPF